MMIGRNTFVNARYASSAGQKATDPLLDFRPQPAESAAAEFDRPARIGPAGEWSVEEIDPQRRGRDPTGEQPGPTSVVRQIEQRVSGANSRRKCATRIRPRLRSI
jgi:hypothetical protein